MELEELAKLFGTLHKNIRQQLIKTIIFVTDKFKITDQTVQTTIYSCATHIETGR